MRHEADLNQRRHDGAADREHLEVAARAGNAVAIAALGGLEGEDAPECPESLQYLLDWVRQLHGRSGAGMSGFAPLTWSTLGEWSRLTGSQPDREDIDALFLLDAVMLNPKPEGAK